MNYYIKKVDIDIEDINIELEEIAKNLGYKKDKIPSYIKKKIKILQKDIVKLINIKSGYKILKIEYLNKKQLAIKHDNTVIFEIGPMISNQLRGISDIAIFACTIGKIEDWIKNFFKIGDSLSGIIADYIASFIVESSGDYLESIITNEFEKQNIGSTKRYSPGYCGWDVKEQKKLFSFLPENFCQISLTDSYLMLPIKSISGIIGLGKNVEKKDYMCSICNNKNCIRNKNK